MSVNKDNGTGVTLQELYASVFGAGGARALLSCAGVVLLYKLAGIKLKVNAGTSGGSIPSALLAKGLPHDDIVRLLIKLEFTSQLTKHATWYEFAFASFMRDHYAVTRELCGVMHAEKLGRTADELIGAWPETFITNAAIGKNSQWLFSAKGIVEYSGANVVKVISGTPAPIGLAIQATCAVPGIIDAPMFMDVPMLDGALSEDGRCPIGVVKNFYESNPHRIIVCDVGEDKTDKMLIYTRKLLTSCLGSGSVIEWEGDIPRNGSDVILIHPDTSHIHSLEFTLTTDKKWQTVISGFRAGVEAFEKAGILKGVILDQANDICCEGMILTGLKERKKTKANEYSQKVEQLMASHGLY